MTCPMKFFFPTCRRGLGSRSLTLLAGLILISGVALGQSQSTATFTGNITTPPQVNATNFYNSGTWNIITATPFTTANTLNYTNVGTMNGSVGWEFDWGPTIAGQRSMSASFFNDSRGTIQAEDNYTFNPEDGYQYLASYLLISATNIVNQGVLDAGNAGEIVLNGENVNLQRSTLEIGAIAVQGSSNGSTNFTPDTAIYDEDWQQTNTFPDSSTAYAFDSSTIWSGASKPVISPTFYWDGLCEQVDAPNFLEFSPTLADSTNVVASYTNIVVTNEDLSVTTNRIPAQDFRQAVFVGTSDPNILVADGFSRPASENISNKFQTVTVQLASALTGNSVYLADTLGSLTNRGLLLDLNVNTGNNPLSPCSDPTYRPANYLMSRYPLTLGSSSFSPPPTNFLYDPATFSNRVVQADYSAYEAYVDDLSRNPTGAALTNLPGRITINATNLDLTKATLYSQGAEITVRADNFEGSTGAVVECQNLSFNLGMTSAPGIVNVTNLVSYTSVPGMHGTVAAWSAVWTNGLFTVFTNYSQITNASGPPTLTNTVFTNVTELDFHALLVDATGLSASVPVTVQDLILQTNTIISDSMNVVGTFLFNGQSLTLQGALNLSGNVESWNNSVAPSLLYFTNNGSLSVPQDAHFGDDRLTNYAAFVNNGNITVGGSETINSDFYQSSGHESAPGGYFVTATIGKIENAGITTSGGDIDFATTSLKLDNSTLSAGGALNFYVPNPTNTSLYDSGGSANNSLTCGNGFNLSPFKPRTGDLLGTTLTSQAYNGAEVDSVWAGENRGVASTGYSNNVALGTLLLSPQGSSAFPPLFHFSGTGTNNALYVDLLDLSQITNLEDMVATDPNLVIYYAAAKLPPEVTVLNSNGVPVQEVETNYAANGQSYYVVNNGVSGQIPQEAEEVLNGQLNGHLRWVGGFAGPNSSVDVIINGQTVAVNKALRYSLVIDSNGDGIPNGVDPNPFSVPSMILTGALLQTNLPPTKSFAISWLAQTNVIYQVEYTTNLSGTNWLPLLNYTNMAPTNRTVTVWDTNALPGERFYRVSHP
jgi:hypothetical protein